jgi:hypothetical protein
MKTKVIIYFSLTILFTFQSLMSQPISVAKTLDLTHHSVVAILRVDSLGKAYVFASGVLIHPQVVLTSGHVNFNSAKTGKGGCNTQGFVSFAENAFNLDDRLPFDWLKDIESHPDTSDFRKSFSDTTGRTDPSMFIDLGLLFLNHPVLNRPVSHLPKPNVLNDIQPDNVLLGVGFGYDKIYDSTFVESLVDGKRRQWQPHDLSLFNDLWLSTQCDTITNLPYISIHDSGAPLFLDDNIIVGIWSRLNVATEPCQYSSWGVRIDNPKVLSWIKDRMKSRLGIDLK